MSFWSNMRVSSAALSAQRLRLDLISNNIANAQTTSTEAGGPYKRQDVFFQAQGNKAGLPDFIANRLASKMPIAESQYGVQVAQIVTDQTTGAKVYDPSHPDSDAEGYVTYPNVDLVTEMTNMLSATRSYEANLAVVDASKNLAYKALNIGK
ncbi:MAG: flagellar basal body rod protein FlgC [Anaerolineae bacterium]|nr:flagellar basal body rod protein FlgC [Anaerolineae bacterium]